MTTNKVKLLCVLLGISIILNLAMIDRVNGLCQTVADQASVISAQEESINSLSSRNSNLRAQTGYRTGEMVCITPSGTKYHRKTCSYIKGSSTAADLSDAKRQGYRACSRCLPPN